MAYKYIFADEAGCLTFTRGTNVSTYFILCTVTMNNCDVGNALLDLRRELVWKEGVRLEDFFHATYDRQIIRDQVYDTISKFDFSVQATVMEKSKSQPQIRKSRPRFYQHGWFYHFKHGMKDHIDPASKMLVSSASIGNKKEKLSFHSAIDDVMGQTLKNEWRTDFRPSKSDPCLQVADYCAWAIQRKWERQDTRSYDLIRDKITYEYNLWERGTTHHY